MISLLIPTCNRPAFLKRLLGYYNSYKITHSIIVADGSSDELKKTNQATIKSYPKLRLIHLDEYDTQTRLYDRLVDSLKYVNTKYCVLCADDDFVTPNGISQSVDFLEKNPDFSIAHGRYISFHTTSNMRRFYWRSAYTTESITSIDPTARLAQHLSRYFVPTFYSVHKTSLLRATWVETAQATNDICFGELLPSMLALVYGKMKCLDVLYAARNESSIGVEKYATLKDSMRVGTYDEQYIKFRGCLSIHLSKQAQIEWKQAEETIDKAMSVYLRTYYPDVILDNKPTASRMGTLLDSLNLPHWANDGIRELYLSLLTEKRNLLLNLKYYKDIRRIRRWGSQKS